MFFILSYSEDSGATWEDLHNYKFDTGQDANAAATRRNEQNRRYAERYPNSGYDKSRYRVRRVLDTDSDNYIAREKALGHDFIDVKGTFSAAYHLDWRMPHWHPENPRQIRFFRTIGDAVAQKYTTTNATRYFTNYCDLGTDDFEEFLIGRGYYEGVEFKVLMKPEEIADAYANGPSSCMADDEDYPLPDPHPVSVYGAGDLGLAIVTRGGEVTARGLVWPEKKIYGPIYGHEKLLVAELEKLGYRRTYSQSAWAGARLLKRFDKEEDEYILPYIDVVSTVSVGRDDFLRLASGSRGSLECKETSGYSYKKSRHNW